MQRAHLLSDILFRSGVLRGVLDVEMHAEIQIVPHVVVVLPMLLKSSWTQCRISLIRSSSTKDCITCTFGLTIERDIVDTANEAVVLTVRFYGLFGATQFCGVGHVYYL